MRVATTSLHGILLTHADHTVILREDGENGDMVLYCATCREPLLRQQKPEPAKQAWSV